MDSMAFIAVVGWILGALVVLVVLGLVVRTAVLSALRMHTAELRALGQQQHR
jgi:hypothetical protein